MTEYERKQIELLTQIAERLARIDARQEKWDKIGLPPVRVKDHFLDMPRLVDAQ